MVKPAVAAGLLPAWPRHCARRGHRRWPLPRHLL